MAFPTTGVLDDFNRANETNLTTNWNGPINVADGPLQLLSNTAQGLGGGDASGWYDASTFGPDSEVFMTITTKVDTGQWQGLFLRLTTPGGSYDCYGVLLFAESGTDTIRMYRYDNAAPTQLGADISQEFSNGDKFGAEMIGDQLTAYRYGGATWASLGTRTDSTYTGAGYLGIRISQGSPVTVMDDFGGGTVVTAEFQSYYATRRRTVGR